MYLVEKTPELVVNDATEMRLYIFLVSLQTTGWSALFFSAEKGDLHTTESLLKAGAFADLKDKVGTS